MFLKTPLVFTLVFLTAFWLNLRRSVSFYIWGQFLLQIFCLIYCLLLFNCKKVGSLKRISVLLISLSNVGVVDLEVCFPIFGTLHSARRYFNITDRSEFSVGSAPHSIIHILKIFTFELSLFRFCVAFFLSRFLFFLSFSNLFYCRFCVIYFAVTFFCLFFLSVIVFAFFFNLKNDNYTTFALLYDNTNKQEFQNVN